MIRNLICNNTSDVAGSFCLYQTGASTNLGTAWPLAWLVERVPGRGRAWLRWNEDEGLAWASTGALAPGVVFFATQSEPAPKLGTLRLNLVPQDGTWSFASPQVSAPEEPHAVRCAASLPANSLAVGLTRGGYPFVAVQAQPNAVVALQPGPSLALSFGNVRPGEVLDLDRMPNGIGISFAPQQTALSATLRADMTWSIDVVLDQERFL